MNTTLTVSGMTCNHCVRRITRALTSLDGVHDVEVDLSGGTVFICHAPSLAPSSLAAAVSSAGYQVARADSQGSSPARM